MQKSKKMEKEYFLNWNDIKSPEIDEIQIRTYVIRTKRLKRIKISFLFTKHQNNLFIFHFRGPLTLGALAQVRHVAVVNPIRSLCITQSTVTDRISSCNYGSTAIRPPFD